MDIKKEDIELETDEKVAKTKSIILREFDREISERENDVMVIQEKIQLTQRYIKILKYVSAYSYYQGEDIKKADVGDAPVETAIHPCVQRLLPSRKEFKPETSSSSSENEVRINVEPPADESIRCVPEFKENDLTVIRGAVLIRHTLVVGNVSKWIPPEYREDRATHKWMLYLRDKKRDDDLEKLIQKVRYFLHESYKPHDIIDVSSAPFHLTRRGWGEFPVRVKIFFNHPNNKPIDFVHQLRLDDTNAGTQMLGGETQIDVDLYHDNVETSMPEQAKHDSPKRFLSAIDEVISNEHDYCAPSGKSHVALDSKPLYQSQQISSLSQTEETSELSVLQNWHPSANISATEWYLNSILKRAKNIYFLTTEACVKWFLQRWPIITSLAANSMYKMVHPYSFSTWQDYVTSNIGKRRAAEWFRAARIMKMLEALNLNLWTTKQIMRYARMHGYTIITEKQFILPSSNSYKNISTFFSEVDTTRDLRQLEIMQDNDEVDILRDEDSKQISFSPVKKSEHCVAVSNVIRFVDETAKEIGIKLKEEEVLPGLFSNSTSQILAKVLKCFVDDLVRKSLANAWLRNRFKNPASIEVEDVIKSIVENPEFDILTNSGLGAENGIT